MRYYHNIVGNFFSEHMVTKIPKQSRHNDIKNRLIAYSIQCKNVTLLSVFSVYCRFSYSISILSNASIKTASTNEYKTIVLQLN